MSETPKRLNDLTPEDRLGEPLKWDPPEIPSEALDQLEIIIGLAVSAKRIAPRTGEWMLEIISINPQRRLSRLGQRIAIVRACLDDIQAADRRLDIAVDELESEHKLLSNLINSHPEWAAQLEAGEPPRKHISGSFINYRKDVLPPT